MKNVLFVTISILLTITQGCHQTKRFKKLESSKTGIEFVNELKPDTALNILSYLYYYNGAGIAAADYNNDGFTDLYFTANQSKDRLFLNQGNLTFKESTEEAGINNSRPWTTSVTHVDINNDGWLDLYICKVGNYKIIEGTNLLYINQGIDNKGVPKFEERSREYGLDIVSFSTQATFFDYDLDGDLDLFLLNHSVHPNRSYGKGSKRSEKDIYSGDKLLRNDNGTFVDVTSESGFYQGSIGYGLGVSVSDINNDGYPDLYIGNDFFENDYLYINQKDGTFIEVISTKKTQLGHTSHYSMGNTISDLNNDGLMDILSLDMLPEDLETYNTSGKEYPYPTYNYYLKNGYAPQFMQNTFHLNRGNGAFSEVANISGIAASEWSWGVLSADFDMDGYKDLYISNGIKGATNDMDFISFIAQDKIQRRLNSGMRSQDMSFIDQLPEKKVSNYAFRNIGDNKYTNVSDLWFNTSPTLSNGCVYVDLDNDGDLDIVVNNIDEPASIYENQTMDEPKSFIKISFEGSPQNKSGIGSQVIIYGNDFLLKEENFPVRSYLSAVPPELTVGLGDKPLIDSLIVVWPGGAYQVLTKIEVNQNLILNIKDATGNYFSIKTSNDQLLETVSPLFDYTHKEANSIEFDRDPLIPYAKTNEGPGISVGDINGDNLYDIFIGGAKSDQARLFVQQPDESFKTHQDFLFDTSKTNENTDNIFFDADNDGSLDLMVVSGGNEFKSGTATEPQLYLNHDGTFSQVESAFTGIEINASVVKNVDIDNDGDEDILIASNSLVGDFGAKAKNYILQNDGEGNFKDISLTFGPSFSNAGLVEDISIADFDGNGYSDIAVAGYWMPIMVFYNDGDSLKLAKNSLQNTNGWWNTVEVRDFDQDGDMDIIAGNWGLNTRLSASLDEPITLYRNDFDQNGKIDPLVTYYYKGTETTIASKDEIVKQLPFLNKKYLSYQAFAKASINELFSKEKINNSEKKYVYELASCYFENKGNDTFEKHKLPFDAQVSCIQDILVDDINEDGFDDLLLVGNLYEISTQLGRLDASHGTVLLNDKMGFFAVAKGQLFDIAGPARDIEKIQLRDEEYFIVSINNDKPVFLRKTESLK